jgi:hypothetical protein
MMRFGKVSVHRPPHPVYVHSHSRSRSISILRFHAVFSLPLSASISMAIEY